MKVLAAVLICTLLGAACSRGHDCGKGEKWYPKIVDTTYVPLVSATTGDTVMAQIIVTQPWGCWPKTITEPE